MTVIATGPTFTDEMREYLAHARQQVSEVVVERLLRDAIGTPSPTGREGELARMFVDEMAAGGLDACYQPIDDLQGNAIARLEGAGGGATLLLYGHLDTHLTGCDEDDAPACDGALPRMAKPSPYKEGDELFGLGAANPKGYSVCMAAAAIAIREAAVPLRGNLLVGLAAGGMPISAPRGDTRRNVGQGVGCDFMLRHGTRPDFAVIGKPGHAVAWEEVGLCYFRIRVKGQFGYAGTRHLLGYKNPIVGAAQVIIDLEAWLEDYARRHTLGYVAPQGIIGSVSAGWEHKPTFVPAWADIDVDIRVAPDIDPNQVEHELRSALAEICHCRHDFECDLSRKLAIPGSRTDPENWIVQSCARAFEETEGRANEPLSGTSGATDAAILRMWGIPTARLGMASHQGCDDATLEREMSSARLPSLMRQINALLYVVIDTCCRERSEVLA